MVHRSELSKIRQCCLPVSSLYIFFYNRESGERWQSGNIPIFVCLSGGECSQPIILHAISIIVKARGSYLSSSFMMCNNNAHRLMFKYDITIFLKLTGKVYFYMFRSLTTALRSHKATGSQWSSYLVVWVRDG